MINFRLLHHGTDNSRICKIESDGKNTTTPIYFASITTASSRTSLGLLIDTIFELPYPNMLFSSYDIHHEYVNNDRKKLCDSLNQYSKENFLFIDSGYFEMAHFNNSYWNPKLYGETLDYLQCDFFASFDVQKSSGMDQEELLKLTKENVENSFSLSKNNQCITIIHGSDTSQLCDLIEGLNSSNAKLTSFCALVEREIGKNIFENYETVKAIRKTLDKTNPNSLLHILGCGDPLSIATLVYAGADSFDSVDWNRWLINPNTLEYENLNHINIIDCSCDACVDQTLDFREKAYRHNLLFYKKFFYDLQFSIGTNKDLITFLKQYHIDEKKLIKLSKYF